MRVDWHNHDPLLVALLLAGVFHALLILGVGFESPKPAPLEKSLDVILVTNPSAKAPDRADYLASRDQQGSGDAKDKAVPRTAPEARQGVGDDLREFAVEEQPRPAAKPKPKLSQARSEKKVVADAGQEERDAAERPQAAASLGSRVAELSAELNESEDDRAKGPRVVEIDAASAHQYKAAAYEAAWSRKIERVGNLNYPDEARRRKLSGSPTLAVGIRPDGSIDSVTVRESSGQPVLDEAAKRIVRLAAPFAPFPEELKQQADILVITRKWDFSMTNRLEARHH